MLEAPGISKHTRNWKTSIKDIRTHKKIGTQILHQRHDKILEDRSNIPQWGAADAEIKVPSDENTKRKGFPFKDWE